ncbi:LodA/GoxA family CTQ-dependent oxidase [Streptomyces flavidovirens]|uniref:LodA/GoxA family CTQ-dependent oxidase n=1 Tax=Streptomyces flavidovirens TaxID=67298 RepID=UPI000405754D|nr:LodA/GoxA family CTQ-dependent oxidase [Streptomyces flavidovirens]
MKQMTIKDVHSVEIHPRIGIARVGNSDAFFVGPEIPGVPPAPDEGEFKDKEGKLKKQAARFRCFGYNADRDQYIELTHQSGVSIKWTVELANKKAAAKSYSDSGQLRNAYMTKERHLLHIAPPPQHVHGARQRAPFQEASIRFKSKDLRSTYEAKVSLGELRTDQSGHLLVLGSSGAAGTPLPDKPEPAEIFDNDGWYDTSSDGRVQAEITLTGHPKPFEAAAWVIVAPPKFAPQLDNPITLWDRLNDVFAPESPEINGKRVPANIPEFPSYTRDIHPILHRAGAMKWLYREAGGSTHQRWEKPYYGAYQRRKIFARLRSPYDQEAGGDMPELAGRANGGHLTRIQYEIMRKWRDGQFLRDWDVRIPQYNTITPEGLDRAALEACVGGSFNPGIEVGQFVTEKNNWASPFVFADTVKPGDVTARMAVPWQSDFHACAETWWPVPRPIHVIPTGASEYRAWANNIKSNKDMVDHWHKLGFVLDQGTGRYLEVGRTLGLEKPTSWIDLPDQWSEVFVAAPSSGDGEDGAWLRPEQLAGTDLLLYGRGEPASGRSQTWPFWLTELDRALSIELRCADPTALSLSLRTPLGPDLQLDDPRLAVTRHANGVSMHLELPVPVIAERRCGAGYWQLHITAADRPRKIPYQVTATTESDVKLDLGVLNQAQDAATDVEAVFGGSPLSDVQLSLRPILAGGEGDAVQWAEVEPGRDGPTALDADARWSRVRAVATSPLGHPFVRERFSAAGEDL